MSTTCNECGAVIDCSDFICDNPDCEHFMFPDDDDSIPLNFNEDDARRLTQAARETGVYDESDSE